MVKKSIVDEIKKCLKSGIPVADSAGGISGDDDNAFTHEVSLSSAQPYDDVFPEHTKITNGISISIKKFEKIVFDDNDFNKDLSKISAVGEGKIKYLEEKYNGFWSCFQVIIKVEIPEEDAIRKRKKAKAVFNSIVDDPMTVSNGIVPFGRDTIRGEIVWKLNREFKFMDEE